MKNQSKAKIVAQNISLPKGGGAIAGLSEKSQVQEFTGSFNYSISFPASPCREVTPGVEISYNSSSGNSAFGLGWDISLPQISRKTSKKIPQYDGTDTFLLDGSDDLIPLNNGASTEVVGTLNYNTQHYILRNEGAFSLITFYQQQGGGNSFWKIIDADHTTSVYGFDASAQIANPLDSTKVFSWLLQEIYNDKGDHQIYIYKQETADGTNETGRSLANQYLKTIRYGCDVQLADSMILTNNAALTDLNSWHFEIAFDYGEYSINATNQNIYGGPNTWLPRPDPFSTYHAGFEIRTYRRCLNILMFHRFAELGTTPLLVNLLSFSYVTNFALISTISQIMRSGYQYDSSASAYNVISLPPLNFGYGNFTPQNGNFLQMTQENSQDLVAFDEVENYQFVDLFSEGVAGILYSADNGHYYARPDLPNVNGYNPSVAISTLYTVPTDGNVAIKYKNWELLESFPNANIVNLVDISGTGQVDLMISENNINGFWEANLDQSFNNFLPFQNFPTDFHASQQRFVDVTGHGLSDLVQLNNGQIRIYPSTGAQGFSAPITNKNLPQNFPNSLLSSKQKIVDFFGIDGSGTRHLTVITANQVSYFPNLGYGNFGAEIVMQNSPPFGDNFNAENLFLADLDGSGAADLIYFSQKTFTIYFNQNGNEFSPTTLTLNLPIPYDEFVKISFADIKGNGNSCLIISDQKNGAVRHFYYDFCQGNKPYLMNEIVNNLGANTSVNYCSSVAFYLANQAAGIPAITTAPFPVQVVWQITDFDVISNSEYSSQYAYLHSYYDGIEREFRGFGRIDRQDSQSYSNTGGVVQGYSFPALSRSWRNIGIYDPDQTIENKFKNEYFSGDPLAFAFDINDIEYNGLTPGANDPRLAYIAAAGTLMRSEIYDIYDQNPYSVSQENYLISLQQLQGENLYASFLTHGQRSISYHYEKNSLDPRISEDVVLELDKFGNVKSSCEIFYPRRTSETITPLPQQANLLVNYSYENFFNDNAEATYLLGVATEAQEFNVTVFPTLPTTGYNFAQIKSAIKDAITNKNIELLSWEQFCYQQINPDNSNTLLPVGTVAIPLLPAKTNTAAFSQTQITDIFSQIPQITDQISRGKYVLDPTNYYLGSSVIQEYFGGENFYLANSLYNPGNNLDVGNILTSYTYDAYNLLISTVTDAFQNQTVVDKIDYNFLQAVNIIDINGNVSQASMDALGRVIYRANYGSETGGKIGFTNPILPPPDVSNQTASSIADNAETFLNGMEEFFYYGDSAFQTNNEPTQYLKISATTYTTNPVNYPPVPSPDYQIAITYLDGFGRLQQSKVKVEAGDAFQDDGSIIYSSNRWLTSGFTVYDNKGAVVKQFEPYYFVSEAYVNNETLNNFGFTSINSYDPLGRQTQAITAKGFLVKHQWTPWEEDFYDANDTITDSPYYIDNVTTPNPKSIYYDAAYQGSAALQQNLQYVAQYFYNTPSSKIFDNVGNVICEQRTNISDQTAKIILSLTHTYDVAGNLLSTSDPRLGTPNFSTTYGLGGIALKTVGADNGTNWVLRDCLGNVIFSYNSRGVALINSYDQISRLVNVTAQKSPTQSDPLALNQTVEKIIYGENSGITPSPEFFNLRGKIYQHYDSAGIMTFSNYDIGGNAIATSRQFRVDYVDEVNWDQNPALQSTPYSQSAIYDALNRIVSETDINGNVSLPQYYQSGRLAEIAVNSITYASKINYNAKGQRTSVQYANNTSTNYGYDEKTWALNSINTSSISVSAKISAWLKTKFAANDNNNAIQNLQYLYDPVGNVIQKTDLTRAQIFYNNSAISPSYNYKYDAIYQLIQADGCELMGISSNSAVKGSKTNLKDSNALENYIEKYSYDVSGNLQQLQHTPTTSSPTITNFTIALDSNRATNAALTLDPTQVGNFFDACGNQIKTQQDNSLSWNYHNNIANCTSSSVTEYYVYDAGGMRVRKISLPANSNNVVETTYFGGIEINTTSQGNGITEQYYSLHISDGARQIATENYWATPTQDAVLFYQLSDSLNSQTMQIDENGNMISIEEFSPYGNSTIFIQNGPAAQLKIYRYCNKEKDATGFYYYGYRYYLTNSARWLSTDPAGTVDGVNLYAFVNGNPVTFADFMGLAKVEKQGRNAGKKNVHKAKKTRFTKHGMTLRVRAQVVENPTATAAAAVAKARKAYAKKSHARVARAAEDAPMAGAGTGAGGDDYTEHEPAPLRRRNSFIFNGKTIHQTSVHDELAAKANLSGSSGNMLTAHIQLYDKEGNLMGQSKEPYEYFSGKARGASGKTTKIFKKPDFKEFIDKELHSRYTPGSHHHSEQAMVYLWSKGGGAGLKNAITSALGGRSMGDVHLIVLAIHSMPNTVCKECDKGLEYLGNVIAKRYGKETVVTTSSREVFRNQKGLQAGLATGAKKKDLAVAGSVANSNVIHQLPRKYL